MLLVRYKWFSGNKKVNQIVEVVLFAAIRKPLSKWGCFHIRKIIFVTFYCWIHKKTCYLQ